MKAVLQSANLKRNCCLIFNFVLERTYNVDYVKEEDDFVKRANIWGNINILGCHSFCYFTEVYGRIPPNYGKRIEVCQTCSIKFRTKVKIYLNKCGEKALLSDTTGRESV